MGRTRPTRTFRVRFPAGDDKRRAKTISVPALTVFPSLRPRQIKTRTGCEQCKRRKVKCDEAFPSCVRCVLRGDTCSGLIPHETWQIEQPWLPKRSMRSASALLGDPLLQHWIDHTCQMMTLEAPTRNPMASRLIKLLDASNALMHAVRSLSHAHLAYFDPSSLNLALQERLKSICSLRQEILCVQSAGFGIHHLEILLLAILILGIPSAWLDGQLHDYGLEHLQGAAALVDMMLSSRNEPSEFAMYLVGFFIYWDMTCSFFRSQPLALPLNYRLFNIARKMRASPFVHPVNGLATELFLTFANLGRYCRGAFDTGHRNVRQELYLEAILQNWRAPTAEDRQDLVAVAEAYRLAGLVMLYRLQTRLPLDCDEDGQDMVREARIEELALVVLGILKTIPVQSPQISTNGFLLTIVGGEVPCFMRHMRDFVEERFSQLYSSTRLAISLKGLDLVRQVWTIRDSGKSVSWLEIMKERGWSLMMG